MYPPIVEIVRTLKAEEEIRNKQIERRRLAIETGTWSSRQWPAWTALRRHVGAALVALGERLRGTTPLADAPTTPAAA